MTAGCSNNKSGFAGRSTSNANLHPRRDACCLSEGRQYRKQKAARSVTYPQQESGAHERVFLTAEWRHLAMLNYDIDAAVLQPYLPGGTELDLFEGKALVSVVGFRFLATKVLGVAIPGYRDFDEVNLRFYVRRRHQGETRRGVVFVREIVPHRAIATVARILYNENYCRLPMTHRIESRDLPGISELSAEFAWRQGSKWNRLVVAVNGDPQDLQPGSEAEFITEHYWGYSASRRRGTVEYQVKHPRWRVWNAREASLEADVAALYGSDFVGPLNHPWRSAFLAEGSAVAVYKGQRLSQR